jgi:hypothetical protein
MPPPEREPSRQVRIPVTPWVFLCAALPVIAVNLKRGRGQFDQEFFHAPAIWQFVSEWPRPDLSDYSSATAPGYHLLMAVVVRYVVDSLLVLKVLGAMFTVALLWLLERAAARRLGSDGDGRAWCLAAALAAPVACSVYVFMPGAWLQPDNAGWLGVLAMLLIGLRAASGRWDALSVIGGGLTMLALVWMRQNHLWAAGVLWVGAWLASDDGRRGILAVTRQRVMRTALAVAATLPAFATVYWFYTIWGGLTPPQFQKQHAGANFATPAFVLALIAIYSHFFIAWTAPGLHALMRLPRAKWVVGGCVVAGLACAAIPETTFLYEERASGLWNLVKLAERFHLTIGGRTSLVMLALAPAGAVMLAAWLVQLPRKQAWLFGLALAGWCAAQTANANAWQRYCEPMLLMVMALMAASVPSSGRRAGRWLWIGPTILAGLLAALTAYTLWSEPIVRKVW